jgi:hypothetical protein
MVKLGRPPKAEKDKRFKRPVHVDKDVSDFFDYLKPNGGYSSEVNKIIRRSKKFKQYIKERK